MLLEGLSEGISDGDDGEGKVDDSQESMRPQDEGEEFTIRSLIGTVREKGGSHKVQHYEKDGEDRSGKHGSFVEVPLSQFYENQSC